MLPQAHLVQGKREYKQALLVKFARLDVVGRSIRWLVDWSVSRLFGGWISQLVGQAVIQWAEQWAGRPSGSGGQSVGHSVSQSAGWSSVGQSLHPSFRQTNRQKDRQSFIHTVRQSVIKPLTVYSPQ